MHRPRNNSFHCTVFGLRVRIPRPFTKYGHPLLRQLQLGTARVAWAAHAAGLSRVYAVLAAAFFLAGGLAWSGDRQLQGRWECYKQQDKAKIPSCLFSVEFFSDGTMLLKQYPDSGDAVKYRYSVKGKRITVAGMNSAETWHFDHEFLENGDLYLSKPPWDWNGWLTKDLQKVPKDHGCRFILEGPLK